MGQKFQGRRVQYEFLGLGNTGLVTAEMYDFDVETAVVQGTEDRSLRTVTDGTAGMAECGFLFHEFVLKEPPHRRLRHIGLQPRP